MCSAFPQLFGVFSVRTLGLDADLTPNTERTVCGFVGLTLLFRGLVRLWWYLDLDLLRRVLILMHCMLSFMILLCAWLRALTQRSVRVTGKLTPESF